MAQVFRARWILPIAAPPVRDGWVAVDSGRIVALGAGAPDFLPRSQGSTPTRDPEQRRRAGPEQSRRAGPEQSRRAGEFPDAAILPGLVNAHVHLELSWMAGEVPPAGAMPSWTARLIAVRRRAASDPREPIEAALRDVRASGTVLVGDVTNTLAAYDALAQSDLSAAVFREVLGFSTADPERVLFDVRAQIAALVPVERLRPAIVPHAPYSVSPSLLAAIAQASSGKPVSVHVAESAEELQFLRTGTGTWREVLHNLGAWNDEWRAPDCGPVEYLSRFGLVNDRLLAVHCVHLTVAELDALASAKATIVTCPRSNQWTGAGSPPVGQFYAAGVRVAIGTDSLASVADLQMFNEIAMVRALAPDVAARRLLESATRHGADALGFGDELGTIEPGKHAELIAVTIPPDVQDVEEYLVGGHVQPQDIRWLKDC